MTIGHQEAISRLSREGMQPLFCQSLIDAFDQGQKCTATIGLHTADYFAYRTSAHIRSLCMRTISLIPAPVFTRRKWNLLGVTSNCPKNREKGYEEEIFKPIWMSVCGDNGEGGIKETKCEIFWPFCPFNFQRILQFFELFAI